MLTPVRTRVLEADQPTSSVVTFPPEQPLRLDAGGSLAPLTIAYQTYGTLDPNRSNAVLICHALTGDQHVANENPLTGKAGLVERALDRTGQAGRHETASSSSAPTCVGGCHGDHRARPR